MFLAEASEKPILFRGEMKASYTKKDLSFTGKLPPSTTFIKGKIDVNNVYEKLQIQDIPLKNTGEGNAKAPVGIKRTLE
jgi:hypothetical protein